VRLSEKLDRRREQRVANAGRTFLIAFRNYALHRVVASQRQCPDYREYQDDENECRDCDVLDQCDILTV
jgi:hypothetical protein